MTRLFARIENGEVAEIIPPLPLTEGWIEMMPEDGDSRVLYGYPPEVWVEITDLNPQPGNNWQYDGEQFSPPYVAPYDPTPEIMAELSRIDVQSVALIRQLLLATKTGEGSDDFDALAAFEARSATLRDEL